MCGASISICTYSLANFQYSVLVSCAKMLECYFNYMYGWSIERQISFTVLQAVHVREAVVCFRVALGVWFVDFVNVFTAVNVFVLCIII